MSKLIKSFNVEISKDIYNVQDEIDKQNTVNTSTSKDKDINDEDMNVSDKYSLSYEEKQVLVDEVKDFYKKQAKEESDKIILETKHQAERFRLQMLEQAERECQKIKSDTYKKTIEKAKENINSQIKDVTEKLQNTINDLESSQKKFFYDIEDNIFQCAIEIAGKILFKKVTTDPNEMENLIKNAINQIKGAGWIEVKVGKELKSLAAKIEREYFSELKDKGTTLNIKAEEKDNWLCVVESSNGIVDASINTQIKNLIKFVDENKQK